MKLHKILPLLSLILTCTYPLAAHTVVDNGNLHLKENRKPMERKIIRVPDVGGYITLKCDLHMHTVFSDGLVWPIIRVQEAWEEGLDAIAITDHLEYSPHKNDIPVKHNRPYEVARQAAQMADILLVKGSEITRDTPPGHFNAIFVSDSSILQTEKEKGNFELDKLAIDRAAEQNAFIFWNHPGWKADSVKGSYEWIDFVDQLLKEDKLHGIEVINGFHLHRKSLDWALEHDLAILGTSDVHNLIAHDYDMEKGVTRSMSLLFVKERSLEGIREALEARRSVAWSTKVLAGSEKWIRKLYNASVSVDKVYTTDKRGFSYASINNDSSLYFELERVDPKLGGWPETITLNPGTSQVLKVKASPKANSARYTVKTAYIGGYENLEVEIKVSN